MSKRLINLFFISIAIASALSQEEFLSSPLDLETLLEESDLNGTGDTITSCVRAQRGKPYKWGAAGPDAFDCSGLSLYCHKKSGINLPHSASAQANRGRSVDRKSLQPGDLVFYDTMGKGTITHVAIYVGGGNIVHAPKEKEVVKEVTMNNSYWNPRFKAARRYW